MQYEGKSIKELRAICQHEDSGYFAQKGMRKLSIYLTIVFVKLKISANAISFLRFFIGVAGIAMIAIGQYWWMVAGILIFHFSILLDLCDGEAYRYYTWKSGKKNTILKGNWLDKLFDFSYRPMLLIAAGIGCWISTGKDLYLILGGIGAMLITLDLMIKVRTPLTLLYKKQEKYLQETGGAIAGNSKVLDIFYEAWRVNNPFTLYFCFLITGGLWAFLIIYIPLLFFQVLKTFYAQWNQIDEYDKKILEEIYGN